MASSLKAEWLDWIADLTEATSRQRLTAALPPQKFHCVLDELPIHLIPQSFVNQSCWPERLSRPLRLNPNCAVLRPGELPAELAGQWEILEGLSLDHVLAWVRDPETDLLRPFWLTWAMERVISRLFAGDAVASLSGQTQRLLLQAGVLTSVDPNQTGTGGLGHSVWADAVKSKARAFREKAYTPIGSLIHPFNLASLRRYYRRAIRCGTIRLGDQQSSRRYVAHNEPVSRFFHHQIAKVVSAVVGEPVKPSYVYFSSYLSGAELKKHTDREQCEFSVSLCLDFSPEPDGATSWPLHLETHEGTVTVYQALGDGLIYRGTKLPHYRSPLAPGYSSTSIFFHYVPADFQGPLN